MSKKRTFTHDQIEQMVRDAYLQGEEDPKPKKKRTFTHDQVLKMLPSTPTEGYKEFENPHGMHSGVQDILEKAKAIPEKMAQSPLTQTGMAALHGINQGLTYNFAPNITAGVRAAGDVATGQAPLKDLLNKYREHRGRISKDYEKSETQNPAAFNSGLLGGGLTTAAYPGRLLNAASSGIKDMIVAGAGQGALSQLGASKQDYTQMNPMEAWNQANKDVIGGGITGAAISGGMSGAGKAAKSAVGHLTNTPIKLLEIYEKTKGTAEQRFKKLQDAIPRNIYVQTELQDAYKTLQNLAFGGSKESSRILKEQGQTLDVLDLVSFLRKEANKIKGQTPKLGFIPDAEKQQTFNYLNGIADKINEAQEKFLQKQVGHLKSGKINIDTVLERATSKGQVPFYELKRIVQGMQKAGYKGYSGDPANKIDRGEIRKAVGSINAYIKRLNPEYGKIMDQVSSDTQLIQDIGKYLGKNSAVRTEGVKRAFERSEYGRGNLSLEALKRLDDRLGTSIVSDLQWSLLREAFDRSAAQGSRNPKVMAEMGKQFPELNKIGFFAALGATIDQWGRSISRHAMDTYIWAQNIGKLEGPEAWEKAIAPIFEAARAGNKEAAATIFLIQKANPSLERPYNVK